MSSYFDFFCKHIENSNNKNVDCIRGTCHTMCPSDEVKLREKEGLVHVLEVLGPVRKLVKSYSRSAADTNIAIPHLLRPYSVLTDTVVYLLLDVTRRVDVPTCIVYDFVNDRLRAVRQDMTIQRLAPEQCAQLLEPMIRFYVFYGYRLWDLPLKDYDPVLNRKYLLECIKWYLHCCDTIDKTQDKENKLSEFMNCLDLNKSQKDGGKLACDRVLMESLYILCNLDDVHPLFRFFTLSKDMKRHTTLRLAYKIAIANLEGNYIKLCRLLDKLCPLTYCALNTYLPTLQRQAFQVMSYAYNSKRLTVPTDAIARWLGFNDEQDVAAACAHYGLKVDADAVRFDKGDFKDDAVVYKTKVQNLRAIFDVNIEDIFTYTTNK